MALAKKMKLQPIGELTPEARLKALEDELQEKEAEKEALKKNIEEQRKNEADQMAKELSEAAEEEERLERMAAEAADRKRQLEEKFKTPVYSNFRSALNEAIDSIEAEAADNAEEITNEDDTDLQPESFDPEESDALKTKIRNVLSSAENFGKALVPFGQVLILGGLILICWILFNWLGTKIALHNAALVGDEVNSLWINPYNTANIQRVVFQFFIVGLNFMAAFIILAAVSPQTFRYVAAFWTGENSIKEDFKKVEPWQRLFFFLGLFYVIMELLGRMAVVNTI